MIRSAETAAWLISTWLPLRSSDTDITRATRTVTWIAPTPIRWTSAAAMPMPTATPIESSIARRRGWPRERPSEMTAAAGAKNGSGWPTISRARSQAIAGGDRRLEDRQPGARELLEAQAGRAAEALLEGPVAGRHRVERTPCPRLGFAA